VSELAPEYEELRRKHETSVPFLEMMQQRDQLRAEKDALREGLIHLIGYHAETGAVPVEKLRALLDAR
jgi:hypothetical protein